MTEAEHAALMRWNAQWHREQQQQTQQQTMTNANLDDDDAVWPMSLAVLAFFGGVLVIVVPFVVLIATLLIGWR